MRKLLWIMALMIGLNGSAFADEATYKTIRESLRELNKMVPIVSVKEAQFPGMYEVMLKSGELLYTNATGSHFVVGEIYKVEENGVLVNLSEEGKKADRLNQIAEVSREDMIIFPAKGETRSHVTVYTDVDCFYCRKLHGEIEEINEMGIEVRYLAFPRAGEGSKAHRTMESIWCAESEQQTELMTQAKQGDRIPALSCENSPVLSQYKLGQQMGVTGTPALLMEDGSLVPGYVPAARLAQMLGVSK